MPIIALIGVLYLSLGFVMYNFALPLKQGILYEKPGDKI
jgi:hypothetical protein